MNLPAAPQPCRFCGSEDGFDQYGHVHAPAWRKVKSIERKTDGKLAVTYESVETDSRYYSDRDFAADAFRCIECGREEAKLEDLVGDPLMFEPGTLVRCPDGFKGVVSTVDMERRRLTVENWHEEFKFSEVDVMVPSYA